MDTFAIYVPAGWEVVECREDGVRAFARLKGDLGILPRQSVSLAQVIFSAARYPDGKAWFHLSMSVRCTSGTLRPPDWEELVWAKEAWMGPETEAYQVVPPRSRYVNYNPAVHHLFALMNGRAALPDFRAGPGRL
jgi:hypothetical protein